HQLADNEEVKMLFGGESLSEAVNQRERSPKVKERMDKNHLVPKPLRRCRSASPLPPRSPLLSQDQQVLIKRSWHRVPRSSVGDSIYTHMIARCPDMRSMFGGDSSSADRHMRHFVGLLQCAVDNLNDMEKALQPWLDLLGKGHGGFPIRSKHWDAFGEAIVTAVSEWIAPGRSHKDTVKAWMLLSSFLSDRLSAASRIAAN
uniref:Globin family profile domain-containing protein n=1 Tax=Parascaris univalens TaxID=6257 RepID=A0A915BZK3_PARUN